MSSAAGAIIGRAAGRATLPGLRDGIFAADQALARLAQLEEPPQEIVAVMEALAAPLGDLGTRIRPPLAEQLPFDQRDGGFVREFYEAALDETRSLRDGLAPRGCREAGALTADEAGVKGLKIRHNNVLGYFVEVTAAWDKLMGGRRLNATFIHRQTLAGQTRFTTRNSARSEAKTPMPGDRALGLELEICRAGSARLPSTPARTCAPPRMPRPCSDVATALATRG